eukprot:scaffold7375_cov268-Pinguiococcus_pyrenoidosus.AAC.60
MDLRIKNDLKAIQGVPRGVRIEYKVPRGPRRRRDTAFTRHVLVTYDRGAVRRGRERALAEVVEAVPAIDVTPVSGVIQVSLVGALAP